MKRTRYERRRVRYDGPQVPGAREDPEPVPSNVIKRPLKLKPMKRIKR